MQKGLVLVTIVMCLIGHSILVYPANNMAPAQVRQIELDPASLVLGGWTGKVGKHAILVCFGKNNSSYFYASQLGAGRGLYLAAIDSEGRSWTESDMATLKKQPTGHWNLSVLNADMLEGKWTAPKGNLSLPIKLERVKKSNENKRGCNFQAMQEALGLHPAQIIEGKEQVFSGIRFRTISALDGAVSSIQFTDSKAVAHNGKLKESFKNEIKQGLECQELMADVYSLLEWPTSYSLQLSSVQGPEWVTLRETSYGDCGGAHPYSDSILKTVDLKTGSDIDFTKWLVMDKDGDLPAKLLKIINARVIQKLHSSRGGEECDSVYTGGEDGKGDFPGYSISLGDSGMKFFKSLPHVVVACSEEIEISYKLLQPYLTQTGREALKNILAK